VFAYTRTLGDDRALIVLNWADEPTTVAVPDGVPTNDLTLELANDDIPGTLDGQFELQPWEARIYLAERQ
jgi:oligo-1,6-glucosidase